MNYGAIPANAQTSFMYEVHGAIPRSHRTWFGARWHRWILQEGTHTKYLPCRKPRWLLRERLLNNFFFVTFFPFRSETPTMATKAFEDWPRSWLEDEGVR